MILHYFISEVLHEPQNIGLVENIWKLSAFLNLERVHQWCNG
jgi:hypothetical protein